MRRNSLNFSSTQSDVRELYTVRTLFNAYTVHLTKTQWNHFARSVNWNPILLQPHWMHRNLKFSLYIHWEPLKMRFRTNSELLSEDQRIRTICYVFEVPTLRPTMLLWGKFGVANVCDIYLHTYPSSKAGNERTSRALNSLNFVWTLCQSFLILGFPYQDLIKISKELFGTFTIAVLANSWLVMKVGTSNLEARSLVSLCADQVQTRGIRYPCGIAKQRQSTRLD